MDSQGRGKREVVAVLEVGGVVGGDREVVARVAVVGGEGEVARGLTWPRLLCAPALEKPRGPVVDTPTGEGVEEGVQRSESPSAGSPSSPSAL